MPNICIHNAIYAPGLERLRELPGVNLTILPPKEPDSWLLPEDVAGQVEILFSSTAPSNLDAAKRLRLLHIDSAGYSQLFEYKLHERGIRACNATGVYDIPIAEWNVAMMINLLRDLRGMIRHQEAGIWDRDARFQRQLRGSTVGFWGYGGLARETARLCKAMGLTVHVFSRSPIRPRDDHYVVPGTGDPRGVLPDAVFGPDRKAEFLGNLDFLIIAMPLTDQTRGLIGEDDLKLLPRRAYLLNPARGPIIQEQALLRALNERWIAGAALDTHYHYPMPPDHPLWKFSNVIMTPHISGSTAMPEFPHRIWDIFVANVERWIAGRPLLNELTPGQLAGQ
jgi:phosphoglycerate dehydrogenase-like enzyme